MLRVQKPSEMVVGMKTPRRSFRNAHGLLQKDNDKFMKVFAGRIEN